MARIRRQFGLAADAVAGGSDYDTIVANQAGVIPAPTEFWPVTGGSLDKNIERTSRANEIRGYRASPAPRPFRARPELTIPVPGYLDIVARVIQWAFGSTPTRTGVAPAALTDAIVPLGYGSTVPPARHLEIVRDDLIHRVSGGRANSVNLDLPLDDDASLEVGFVGLFYQLRPGSGTPGTPTFTLPVRPLQLRDAKVYLDGSLQQVPDLISAGFTFTNGFEPKWYSGRNRVPDASSACQFVHFPAEQKFKASQQVGYRLNLGNTSEAEEAKQDFARAQKLVLEVEECPQATTPASVRLLRITIAAGVHEGGGAEGLTKDDDITSPFEGAGYFSDADGFDIKAEIVHSTATLFAN